MISISKNVYINILHNLASKYNNAYHNTINMKPVDVTSSTYINFNKENNKKDPRFKVGDHMRTSKHKNIFAKDYFPNWSEEVFVIISDLNGEGIIVKWKNYDNLLNSWIDKKDVVV